MTAIACGVILAVCILLIEQRYRSTFLASVTAVAMGAFFVALLLGK